jgi:hypothetical protein
LTIWLKEELKSKNMRRWRDEEMMKWWDDEMKERDHLKSWFQDERDGMKIGWIEWIEWIEGIEGIEWQQFWTSEGRNTKEERR